MSRNKFRQLLMAIAICLTTLLMPLPALAISIDSIPNPRQVNGTWVEDTADVFSYRVEDALNGLISQSEARNGTEIAVVTVTETSPSASAKEFGTELFNYWGIGKKGLDNGVLVLISAGERRVEIETGYGIEQILPDIKVKSIIHNQMIPSFRKGDFETGTVAGVEALIAAIDANLPAESMSSTYRTLASMVASITELFSTVPASSPEKTISPIEREIQSVIVVTAILLALAILLAVAICKFFSESEVQNFNVHKCPKCARLTLVQFTAQISNDKQVLLERCSHCSFERELEQITQRARSPQRSVNFNFLPPSSESGNLGSSWLDNNSDGFGGGSSGGGGAGDDW